MNLKIKKLYYLCFALIALNSCITTSEDELIVLDELTFSFDKDFSFQTNRIIEVLPGNSDAITKIYFIDNHDAEHYIGKFSGSGDVLSLNIPSYVSELKYIQYINGDSVSNVIELKEGQEQIQLNASPSGSRISTNDCIDHLYAVNGQSGFYQIDVNDDNYNTTALPNLPGGSIANALDQENGFVYINVNTTLYKYDVNSESFEIAFSSNPYNKSYPRFEYREDTFYMGDNKTMYTVKASTNEIIQKYDISGFVNSDAGGDLAFASDGTLYLACFSGLYKFIEMNKETGIATIERVSAENFPFQLTSMAIDRQDRIFVGTNDSNSRLIEISKEDGAYAVVKTFNHKINDLTAWKCVFDEGDDDSDSPDIDDDGIPTEEDDDIDGDGIIDEKDDDIDGDGTPNTEDEDMDGDGTPNDEDTDIDGDGVINPIDDYPEDPAAAGTIYTPSKLGYGTLAFEDNWPLKGDYDFNDLVIQYKVISKINKDNNAISMDIELILLAAGGDYRNGFGIELPIAASLIENVEGHNAPASMVNERGLEIGQAKPVIVAFTDAIAELGGGSVINADPEKPKVEAKIYNISIAFTELVNASQLADAPYNPFIFINGDRGRELHNKDFLPTSKLDLEYLGSADDASEPSSSRYYFSDDNAPFAIDISHTFRYPKEGLRIDRAYNYFLEWAQSNGTTRKDWYTDAGGYRNLDNIFNID